MAVKVGDRLPEAKFRVMGPDGPAVKTTADIFKGRKVVLFAVPGAFTPTCNNNHLPGFLKNADAFKSKGVDTIAVMASMTCSYSTPGRRRPVPAANSNFVRRQRRVRQGAWICTSMPQAPGSAPARSATPCSSRTA